VSRETLERYRMGAYGRTRNQLFSVGYIKWSMYLNYQWIICSWEAVISKTATGHAMAQAVRY